MIEEVIEEYSPKLKGVNLQIERVHYVPGTVTQKHHSSEGRLGSASGCEELEGRLRGRGRDWQ